MMSARPLSESCVPLFEKKNGLLLFQAPAPRIARPHSEKHCVSLPILNNSAIFSHLESLFEALWLDGL